MPREGTRMARLWERELGRLTPNRFANSVIASEDYVHSLSIQKRLRMHRGCVNTISFNGDGRLLLSGSDDRMVTLWNWDDAVPTFTFHSGHNDNILHAQFMPYTDDRSIITCAADGEVRHSQIHEEGSVSTSALVKLDERVHKMAIEPGSPHTFYSCGEDGSVWRFDLRWKNAVELVKCGPVDHSTDGTIKLYAIAIDPRNPNFLAVAGNDEYTRMYDIRNTSVYDSTSLGHPIEYFCPPHLIGENMYAITGLAFSQTSELLASYSYDQIYLFSRDHGLHFNNVGVGPRLLMDEFEENVYHKISPLPSCGNKLPVPQAFEGHRNRNTVKGVNFLGPNCEYVTSGSDCGRVFIWRKKDGMLMRVMEGDKQIVNCVEQHPLGSVVASSGISNDIKIWAPGVSKQPSSVHIDEVETDLSCSESSGSDDLDYFDEYIVDMDIDSAEETESEDNEDGEDEEDEEDDEGNNSGEE